eukprot:3255897-Rhodomonas_salina.2
MAAEQAKLTVLEEKIKAANWRFKEKQDLANHKWSVHFMSQLDENKQDEPYTCSLSHWDQSHDIPAASYSTICLNVKHLREYLQDAAVDLASPIDIQNELEQV